MVTFEEKMRQHTKIGSWIAAVLLCVFLLPFVLKGVHHHEIEYQRIDRSAVCVHTPQETCDIFQFEYLSFLVVGFNPHLLLTPITFRWEASLVQLRFTPQTIYFQLRAPPVQA